MDDDSISSVPATFKIQNIPMQESNEPITNGNDAPAQQCSLRIIPDVSSPASLSCGSRTSDSIQRQGMCLAFKDIVFSVRCKDPITKKMTERKILKECTGILRPGTLNAIMGASGGGKTSLLDVLADRKSQSQVSGTVLVNGKPRKRKLFMHQSGYVPQDDLVMGTLTVRENLMFSASLRLPESISLEEKQQRVDEVIEELGLTKVADQKVGNELVRGISGGERKRVNVGMELITSPRKDVRLYFRSISLNLKSSVLRTTFASIYSTNANSYSADAALFDSITLLSDGYVVYHGPSRDCVPYFDSVGYQCGQFNNPADFILDVITGVETRRAHERSELEDNLVPHDEAEAKHESIIDALGHLTAAYATSEMASRAIQDFENERCGLTLGSDKVFAEYKGDYGAAWTTQVTVCSKRALLNVVRNPATSIGQVLVNIIVAVITGLIFYRLDQHQEFQAVLRDRTGCMFFICVTLQFSNLSAIEIFLKERVIYIHEKTSGYYYPSAYFASKLLCDMIPVRIVPTLIFGALVYFMVGFQPSAAKFFWFEFIIVLQSVVSAAVCFACSAMCSVLAVANLTTTLWYVFTMIFSGLLVSINSWPAYTRWLGYTSFSKSAYELLLENEFRGLVFDFPCGSLQHCTGEAMLGPNYINISTDPISVKVGTILIITAGFLYIGYIILARLRRC